MAYWGIYRVLLVTGGLTQLGCAVNSSRPVPPELVSNKKDIVGSLLGLRSTYHTCSLQDTSSQFLDCADSYWQLSHISDTK